MTSSGRGSVDESSGATNEGVVTSGGNNHEGLTTLDGGRSIALVALVLVNSKRFTGDGRLINLEIGILGDDTSIGRDDGTLLDLQDITGNDLGRLDLLEGTVTKNNSLERKGLLELVDNGTGLEFLDETDGGVEKEKSADDTEINPILETGSKNSSSLDGNRRVSKNGPCWNAMFVVRSFPGPIVHLLHTWGSQCSFLRFNLPRVGSKQAATGNAARMCKAASPRPIEVGKASAKTRREQLKNLSLTSMTNWIGPMK